MLERQRLRLFTTAMACSTLLGGILVLGRFLVTGSLAYSFTIFNCWLAWVPFGCALLASVWLPKQGWMRVAGWIALGFWLLFLPNSPYLFTDFIHFRHNITAPWWFDVGMLLTFSATSLLLGLASLLIVHRLITDHSGRFAGWTAVWAAAFLSGFGIYVGRFLRWNSWDAVMNPLGVLADLGHRFADPLTSLRIWGVTLLYGAILGGMYVALYALTAHEPAPKDA